MDIAYWNRVEALFDAAVELPPQERPAYLDRACAGDAALRQAVEQLLEEEPAWTPPAPLGAAGDTPEAMRALPVGERLAGRYEVVGRLGEGGMGAVYLALDHRLYGQRYVALKQAQPEARPYLEKEGRILCLLDHPNLLGILDTFEEAGQLFIVTKYVEGESLQARLDRLQRPFDLPTVLRLSEAALDALHYLHTYPGAPAAGRPSATVLVHRDVKPANLLLDKHGHLYLADFGAASSGDTRLTSMAPSRRYRTSGYAPLEQELGEAATPHSDLYALGVTTFVLLTGAAVGDLSATRRDWAKREGKPDPLHTALAQHPEIPPPVAAWIRKATMPFPDDRYESAAAMRAALHEVRKQLAPRADLPPPRRLRWRLVVGLPAALVLLVLAGRPWLGRPSSGPAPATRPSDAAATSVVDAARTQPEPSRHPSPQSPDSAPARTDTDAGRTPGALEAETAGTEAGVPLSPPPKAGPAEVRVNLAPIYAGTLKPNANVLVDDRPAGTLAGYPLTTERHRLRVRMAGYRLDRVIRIDVGDSTEVAADAAGEAVIDVMPTTHRLMLLLREQ